MSEPNAIERLRDMPLGCECEQLWPQSDAYLDALAAVDALYQCLLAFERGDGEWAQVEQALRRVEGQA